jgi:hypothetical protein
MIAIFILISSFVVAILGFIQSNAAKSESSSVFGLTYLGVTLIGIAAVGFAFGIVKEIQNQRGDVERTQMLKELHAKLLGEAEHAPPEAASRLREIGDRIRRIAMASRESDFSMSDFARSRFTKANFRAADFTGANFMWADFQGADFRGANLHGIITDTNTVLPSR